MRRLLVLLTLVLVSGCAQAGQAASAVPAAIPTALPSGTLDPRLLRLDQVPGVILDVSPVRILFLDQATGTVTVKDRTTATLTRLPTPAGMQVGTARLTPRGAVLVATKANSHSGRLYEWPGTGGLTDLGALEGSEPVVVRDSVLAWNDGATLFRRNLDTGQTTAVEPNAWTTGFGVLANGDVVYTSADGQLERFHNGTRTALTRDPAARGFGPVTDGTMVAFTLASTCCEVQRASLWRYDGTTSTALTTQSGKGPDTGGYEIAGVWTAFTAAASGGRRQVWRRGPDGVVSQLSDAGGRQPAGDARVVAISPAGVTVYAVADTLYLGVVGLPSVALVSGYQGWASHRRSRTENFALYVDGRLQLAVQGTLFSLIG